MITRPQHHRGISGIGDDGPDDIKELLGLRTQINKTNIANDISIVDLSFKDLGTHIANGISIADVSFTDSGEIKRHGTSSFKTFLL